MQFSRLATAFVCVRLTCYINFFCQKRTGYFDHGLATNVCPRKVRWERLDRGRDMNNTEVTILQTYDPSGIAWEQWFYTISCDFERLLQESECPTCCLAIDHNRFVLAFRNHLIARNYYEIQLSVTGLFRLT